MDQSEDPRELERKIEQAVRIASSVADQTTVQRHLAVKQVSVLIAHQTRFSAPMVEGNVLAAEMSGFVPLQPGSDASSLN